MKQKTCSYPSCQRKVLEDGKCLFHLEHNDGVRLSDLTSELDDILSNSGVDKLDTSAVLDGCHFPASMASYFNCHHPAIAKAVSFRDAHFHGDMSFSGSCFQEAAHFERATFYGHAWFTGVEFSNIADFAGTNFRKTSNFNGAIFQGQSNFSRAHFSGEVDFGEWEGKGGGARCVFVKEGRFDRARFDTRCEFRSTVFESGLRFRHVITRRPQNVHFHNCDLSGALFAGTDLSSIDFVGANWPYDTVFAVEHYLYLTYAWMTRFRRVGQLDRRPLVVKEKFFKDRKCLYDEKDLRKRLFAEPQGAANDDIHEVYKLYSQLKRNYQEKHLYHLASDWHVGEMEMRRLQVGRSRVFPFFYRILSGYGERHTRAIACLAILFLIFLAANRALGFNLNQGDANPAYRPGIVDSFAYTLKLFTLQRQIEFEPVNAGGRIVAVLAGIFGPLQLGLVALSLKRYFRR